MTGDELYVELAAGLDEAVGLGHLPNPGVRPGADETRNDTDSRSYIKALRSRLVDLGYLEETNGNRTSGKPDPEFIKAVERFQSEVGKETLRLDGWAGPKTWTVLQQLVSFEDKHEPRSWDHQILLNESPAVARAAWLRLWVMGFFVEQRKPDDKERESRQKEAWDTSRLRFSATMEVSELIESEPFRAAFARFREFARRLELSKEPLPAVPQLNEAFLDALFNYDEIVGKLADADQQTFHDFQEQIEAIARIEFWLLGYEGVPGGPQKTWVTRTVAPGRDRREEVPLLPVVIGRFWEDYPDRRGRARADGVSVALFAEFRELLREPEVKVLEVDQVVWKVNEVLNQEKRDNKGELPFVKVFENLASSIWDGVKRLAKFIWRLIRGAVSAVTNLVRNLARYIASEARDFFYIVVRAVDAVHGGIAYLRNSIYPATLPSPVIIARAAGFDYSMLVDASAATLADSPVFAEYRRQARCYCAGCVILGELAGMLGRVVQLASGALAGPLLWLRALLALGRFRASIEQVKEALKELDENYTVSGAAPGALMLTDVV